MVMQRHCNEGEGGLTGGARGLNSASTPISAIIIPAKMNLLPNKTE